MKIYSRSGCDSKAIVEIMGISGAGKSYLSRLIAEDLQLSEFAVPSAGFAPSRVLRSLYCGYLKFGLRKDRYRTSRIIFSTIRRSDSIGRSADGAFVVEEGLFQLVFVTIGQRTRRELRRIAEDVFAPSSYRPTALFSLLVSPQTLQGRRRLRNMKLEKQNEREILKSLELYRRHTPHVQWMADAIGCDFVELDVSTNEGTEIAMNAIRTTIKRHWPCAREAEPLEAPVSAEGASGRSFGL